MANTSDEQPEVFSDRELLNSKLSKLEEVHNLLGLEGYSEFEVISLNDLDLSMQNVIDVMGIFDKKDETRESVFLLDEGVPEGLDGLTVALTSLCLYVENEDVLQNLRQKSRELIAKNKYRTFINLLKMADIVNSRLERR